MSIVHHVLQDNVRNLKRKLKQITVLAVSRLLFCSSLYLLSSRIRIRRAEIMEPLNSVRIANGGFLLSNANETKLLFLTVLYLILDTAARITCVWALHIVILTAHTCNSKSNGSCKRDKQTPILRCRELNPRLP